MLSNAPTARIIETLRKLLRVKGYHHRDIASRLDVSEGTVKRYLNGKGVTLEVLQRLAELVGLDVLSLAEIAQREIELLPEMTRRQQAALRKLHVSRTIYFLLIRGWTTAQIERDFEFSRERMEGALNQLQSLKLIRRVSTRGTQLLARPTFGNDRSGELGDVFVDIARQFVRELDFRDPSCDWVCYPVRLSPTSAVRMKTLIRRFISDLHDLSIGDLDLPPQNARWYRVLICGRPTPPRF